MEGLGYHAGARALSPLNILAHILSPPLPPGSGPCPQRSPPEHQRRPAQGQHSDEGGVGALLCSAGPEQAAAPGTGRGEGGAPQLCSKRRGGHYLASDIMQLLLS